MVGLAAQRMRDSELGMLINLKFRGNRTSLCLDFSAEGMMNNRIERTDIEHSAKNNRTGSRTLDRPW